MESGRILWDELALRYQRGVDSVRQMQRTWDALEGSVDPDRFRHIKSYLEIQESDAEWWRDAVLLYFQTFSKRPVPAGVEKPEHTLEYYMQLDPKFVPGI
jgi:alpha-glucuronidase